MKNELASHNEIILDTILEDRADIPINAIYMYSGFKADLYPVREGMSFDKAHFDGENEWIMGLLLERYTSIPQRISFFISSCTLD